MEFFHHETAENFRKKVEFFMKECDEDFDPPFSKRGDLNEVIDSYIDGKEIIIVKESSETIGMALFTRGGKRDEISEYCPCIYVNLIIVMADRRGEGIGSSIYRFMIENILPESDYEFLAARTWKDNKISKSCLRKSGFEKRAVGKSEYNTVYYYVYQS